MTNPTNIFDPDAAVPADLPPLDVCSCGKVPPAHADSCQLRPGVRFLWCDECGRHGGHQTEECPRYGAYHRRRTVLWSLPAEVTGTETVDVESAVDGYGDDERPHLWIGGSVCLSGSEAVRALAGVLLAAARTMDEQEDEPVVTPVWFAGQVTAASSTPLYHAATTSGGVSLTLRNGWSVTVTGQDSGIAWEARTSTGVLAVAGGWKPGDTRPAGQVAADVADLVDTFLSARA